MGSNPILSAFLIKKNFLSKMEIKYPLIKIIIKYNNDVG